jgi:hypothetical protein
MNKPLWKRIAGIFIIASLVPLMKITGVEWWQAMLFYTLGALAAILYF